MMKDDKMELDVYISKRKEKIIIDEDVIAVMEIMDEIIEHEETAWRKNLFDKIKKGCSDISIIIDSPMERTKYYIAKNNFIDKIYQCCIYKGLVEYEDILRTEIG